MGIEGIRRRQLSLREKGIPVAGRLAIPFELAVERGFERGQSRNLAPQSEDFRGLGLSLLLVSADGKLPEKGVRTKSWT